MSRNKIIITSAFIALAIILIIASLGIFKHKGRIYSGRDTVCFERDILPVFTKSCGVIGCHDQPSASAGFVLTDYNTIIKGVTPSNPNKSIVYKALIGKGAAFMPPGKALTKNETMLIRVWIGQGAKNTACPVGISPP